MCVDVDVLLQRAWAGQRRFCYFALSPGSVCVPKIVKSLPENLAGVQSRAVISPVRLLLLCFILLLVVDLS